MTRSLQEAAQDLVAALSEACAALTALNRLNEKYALANEAQEEKHLFYLTERLSADTSEESARKCQEWLEETLDEDVGSKWAQANKTGLNEAIAGKRRWENALNASQAALYRLRDFPETQESASGIEDLLQNSRLPPTAARPRWKAPEPPDLSGELNSNKEQENQRQTAIFRYNLETALSRYEHQKQVRQSHAQHSQHIETLINQAREQAEALTRRVNL